MGNGKLYQELETTICRRLIGAGVLVDFELLVLANDTTLLLLYVYQLYIHTT